MSSISDEFAAQENQWSMIAIADCTRHLVSYRYGIGFFGLLAGWVLLAFLFAPPSIVANALRLETYFQLGLVSSLNFVVAVFSVALLRVLNHRFPPVAPFKWFHRVVGDGGKAWGLSQFILALVAAAPTPILLSTVYASEFSGWLIASDKTFGTTAHFLSVVVFVALSFVIGWWFLRFLGFAKTQLFGSQKDVENFLPFEDIYQRGLLRHQWDWLGLFVKKRLPSTEEIDVQLGLYVVLLAFFHFASTRIFTEYLVVVVSAPLVIVVILLVVFMLLIGLAYWLDKLRIPVLLVLFIAMVFTNLGLDRNYTLKTQKDGSASGVTSSIHSITKAEADALGFNHDRTIAVKDAAKPLEDIVWNAISERMNQKTDSQSASKRIVVVVTCPGGGIHAAAWSSYVLETLSNQYPKFRNSICVISGVSGGSVGTLFFVSTNYRDEISGVANSRSRHTAFEYATQSSLEHISIGLMTDDLYGAFLPPLSMLDRGQRLEDSFRSRIDTNQRTMTLNQWGDVAIKGKMPIVVFNATDAVTGRRVLFDSLPTPLRKSNIGLTSRPYNYRELITSGDTPLDVSPMSGARASASFPYVSTFTSIEGGNVSGKGVAIGDGGYVDNEGIVTAVDWVQFLLEKWSTSQPENRPFDQILVLRIMPAVNSDSLEPPKSHWFVKNLRWLAGPLETIANVRATSQAERGNLETDLTALYLTSPSINEESVIRLNMDVPENQTKVFGMSPDEKLSKPANRTREEASRERYMDRVKRTDPALWNVLSEKDALKATSPSVGAFFGPELSNSGESPILVIEIPFESELESQIIPLNWKLTKKQKDWYRAAWERVETNQGEDMDTLRRLFSEP